MTRVVSVHSFRGGTGKSNLIANLASVLAGGGATVGVVDTDIQSPGIHVLFGVDAGGSSTEGSSLNDYLWERCSISEAAHDVGAAIGLPERSLYLIPSSLRAGEIAKVLREGYDIGLLADGFRSLGTELGLDYLLIDTPPGINEETLLSITISDALIVVMRPDRQDFQGTAVTIDVARKLEIPELMLVINKVPESFDPDDVRAQAEAAYDTSVTALFPHSDEMMALGSEVPFAIRNPEHPISVEVAAIAERLRQGAAVGTNG